MSAIVSDLVAGQEYSFRVKATNLVGDGAWSSIYKFLNVDRPSEPLNLHLDSFDNTYVTFSWEQPIYNGGQALSGFKVYRQECSDSTNDHVIIHTTNAATFQYTDTAISGGN